MLTQFSPKAARLRTHLTYANVMSTLCFFAVVGGGTAYAAIAANQVNSRSIKNNAVRSVDVKDGALTGGDVSDSSLTGADVANDSLTGQDVNESTLDLPGAPASLPPSGPAGGDLTGSYPNPLLAANSVSAAEILDGTIDFNDIANNGIAAEDIQVGSLTGTQIGDNSLTGADINESTLGQVPDSATLQGSNRARTASEASSDSDFNQNALVVGSPESVLSSAQFAGNAGPADALINASVQVSGSTGGAVHCQGEIDTGDGFTAVGSTARAEFTAANQEIQLPVVGFANNSVSGTHPVRIFCSALANPAIFEGGDLTVLSVPE